MKYILKKIQYLKRIILMTMSVPFIIFLILYPLLKLHKFEKIGTFIAYNQAMNQAIYYYLPIISVYLYIVELLPLDYFERAYVYKFKSKWSLLKSNLILLFTFTVAYIFIVNTVFLGLVSLITNGGGKDLRFLYFSSLILHILIFFIYSLIICISNYIFIKHSTLANLIIKTGILLGGFIAGVIPETDYLGKIFLYSYFNVQSIYAMHKNVIWVIFLLLFIIFILISILKFIIKNVDYLKYLHIKE